MKYTTDGKYFETFEELEVYAWVQYKVELDVDADKMTETEKQTAVAELSALIRTFHDESKEDNLLNRPIRSEADAIAYIVFLLRNDWLYHFDDSAVDVLWNGNEPTVDEMDSMDERAEDMRHVEYTAYECQFDIALAISDVW